MVNLKSEKINTVREGNKCCVSVTKLVREVQCSKVQNSGRAVANHTECNTCHEAGPLLPTQGLTERQVRGLIEKGICHLGDRPSAHGERFCTVSAGPG